MIRVTNTTIFDRITTQLSQQQARLAETQEKISTGRNFLRPSDAPDQVAALDRLESTVRQTERYSSNIGRIKDKLSLQELAITSMNNDLTRAKELMVQGANGTLNAASREALAIELDSIYNNLIAIGNRKDVDGSYLFSGYVQDEAPFDASKDPLLTAFSEFYAGNDEIQKIAVDDGYTIDAGMPGSRLYAGFESASGARTNLFKVLKSASEALKADDGAGMTTAIDDIDNALTHINVRLAQVGSKMRTAENQMSVLTDRSATLEQIISQVEELDYISAVTELKNQTLALQAGQSSFAQISNLSLFNYIK